jgi:hypothetical protein
MLKIYDDVLDKQFLDYINYTIHTMLWIPHSSKGLDDSPVFFNSVTIDIQRDIQRGEYIFLFHNLMYLIENEPEIKGKEIQIERGYVNLYPYGIGGDWHTDSDNTNSKTILFFPSDWKEEYGGETEFHLAPFTSSFTVNEFQPAKKVEYKKNRLLIFDGTIPHKSAVHQNPKNRYTVAFKMNIKEEKSNVEN